MNKLSIKPYKGTKDYYPKEKRVQNYIFNNWKKTVEKYGYQEYGAPLLESMDLYAAKSGEELVNEQTYSIEDRGGRNVAIRPEMTPSVSRMVAGKRQELGYPARLFSLANFMRYERPQRGREREFWQLNVDIFGVDSVLAEVEILTMAYQIVKDFGAKDNMFVIKVNDRNLIDKIMRDYLELDSVQSNLMIKLFDRKNKIKPEQFRDQAIEIFGQEKASEGLSKIAKMVGAKSISEFPEKIQSFEEFSNINKLFEKIHKNGVKNAQFDITLMRGLDYYTGMVFEVFDTDENNNRAMFGGGRYDGLVGLFGVDPISTVGMAPGLTPMTLFLETHNLIPDLKPTTDASIIVLGEDSMAGAQSLAKKLRAEGVRVDVDITLRKIDKQIKAALKRDVGYLIFVGEDEVKEELYTLKDVKSEKEEKLGVERIISILSDYRNDDDDFDL